MIINPLSIQPKTWLEEKTYQILHELDITTPNQIDLFKICSHLKVDLLYTNLKSHSTICPIQSSDYYKKIINYLTPEQKQRELIAHELGHILLHSGNQLLMRKDFVKMQETQAERFTGYLLVPFFMFNDIELPEYTEQAIYSIAKTFNITLPLASKRYDQLMLRQYENQYKFIN